MSRPTVVFTDLDGTFLHFESYSAASTEGLLHALRGRGVHFVFCSSKTLAEQRALMSEIRCPVPAIVENGGGLYLPPECTDDLPGPLPADAAALPEGGYLIPYGPSTATIRAVLAEAAARLGLDLATYAELGPEKLVALTGLTPAAAGRAIDRQFSETFTAALSPAEHAALTAALTPHGLQYQGGGRFHTVTGDAVDKGRAVHAFCETFLPTASDDRPWRTVGLGDGPNDASLLAAVECPYLVRNHEGTWSEPRSPLPRLRRVPAIGPEGWVHALAPLLTSEAPWGFTAEVP